MLVCARTRVCGRHTRHLHVHDASGCLKKKKEKEEEEKHNRAGQIERECYGLPLSLSFPQRQSLVSAPASCSSHEHTRGLRTYQYCFDAGSRVPTYHCGTPVV